ncbi:ATP-binding protein [Pseudothauera lacus]|uniref:Histidine kinase/HSP90-like ATPase domain-containing protein n=1 Tax=Pseudothauera lacus TaxID=2136175 RepID=A0A2T4IFZ7_9RHOO|nr:ATP-binding protein [Pseudothauera lacus]PTD96626.1 hypothetical protein C8261_07370 [Pseudothauera lacus]
MTPIPVLPTALPLAQPPLLSLNVRTLADAAAAAHRAAALCAEPARAQAGLHELLVNGIEHGNLGIDHALKAELLGKGEWEAEVARRLALPALAGRRVRVSVWRLPEGWCFEVGDDGEGFDWQPWLGVAPQRAAAPNGRGIALAGGLYFDELSFVAPGNRVRALLREAAMGAPATGG